MDKEEVIELMTQASKWGSWAYDIKERERRGKVSLENFKIWRQEVMESIYNNKLGIKSNVYTINMYDEFEITGKGTVFSFSKVTNYCPEIKIGDHIRTLNGLFEVTGVEKFMKSFGIVGDNVGVLVKKIEDEE